MDIPSILAGVTAGVVTGAVIGWFMRGRSMERERGALQSESATLRERIAARDAQVADLAGRLAVRETVTDALRQEAAGLQSDLVAARTAAEKEREAADEKLAVLDRARAGLADAFKALSSEALKNNNEQFLHLARATLERFQQGAAGDLEKRQQAIGELMRPVREGLERFDRKVDELEKSRVGAYEGLREQVSGLRQVQDQLRVEAHNLVRALGTPRVRGRWGEMQLRRVVEMAGMMDHVDFVEQSVTPGDARLRPDMVVRLPSGRRIVVDAKAPLEGYLKALEAPDDATRTLRLADHARQIRDHVTALGRKAYWEQFEATPEFVVLFLPGETFFLAALEADPELVEQGVSERVLIATPTTLIALLKAVAYGWRQEHLADNAREISALGRELHKRLSDFGGHLGKLGERLDRAVESYNDAVGSLESRVLVSARKFQTLDAAPDVEIGVLEPVERATRSVQAPELTAGGDS